MGHNYDLPDLVDLADIMRLAGADGTRIYSSLRARGAAVHNATLNQQISRANADGERIAIPVTLLVLVLAITLVVPRSPPHDLTRKEPLRCLPSTATSPPPSTPTPRVSGISGAWPQSTENAILLAGAVGIAVLIISAITAYVQANLPS